MLNLFKKKQLGETVKLKLSGLHCASCSLNIDDSLESTPGVISSKTSYAKQESVINYAPAQVTIPALKKVITSLGYQVL